MNRQLKREVKIGNITIGGNHPIAVQTMLNVPVKDIDRTHAGGCRGGFCHQGSRGYPRRGGHPL